MLYEQYADYLHRDGLIATDFIEEWEMPNDRGDYQYWLTRIVYNVNFYWGDPYTELGVEFYSLDKDVFFITSTDVDFLLDRYADGGGVYLGRRDEHYLDSEFVAKIGDWLGNAIDILRSERREMAPVFNGPTAIDVSSEPEYEIDDDLLDRLYSLGFQTILPEDTPCWREMKQWHFKHYHSTSAMSRYDARHPKYLACYLDDETGLLLVEPCDDDKDANRSRKLFENSQVISMQQAQMILG